MIRLLRRRSLRWLVLLVFVLLGAYFLPMLMLATPLSGVIVRSIAADLNGEVSVGRIEAGWFSPVVLKHVRLTDSDKGTVIACESISTGKSIWSMWRLPSQWTQLQITGLNFEVRLREGGSNVEDVIAKILAKPKKSGKANVNLKLEASGTGTIARVGDTRPFQLHDVNLLVELAAGSSKLEFRSSIDHATDSRLELTLNVKPTGSVKPHVAKVATTKLPLKLVSTLLNRFRIHLPGTGDVSGEFQFAGDLKNQQWRWSKLHGSNVRLAYPERFGTEQLELAQFSSEGQFELKPGAASMSAVRFDSPMMNVMINGGLRFNPQDSIHASTDLLVSQDYHLSGRVDVARLVQQFPLALGIRQRTRVRSGTISFDLRSQEIQEQRSIRWSVGTDQIEAEHDGRVIRWQKPISIRLAARQTNEAGSLGLVLDELVCTSAFATANLRGTKNSGELSADVDLDRLRQDIKHLFDLRDVQLAGRLKCGIRWHLDTKNRVWIQGSMPPRKGTGIAADLANLRLRLPGWQPWHESSLLISLDGNGTIVGDRLSTLDKLDIGLLSQNDRVDLTLLSPIKLPKPDLVSLRCRILGQLEPWQARLQLLDGGKWRPTGRVDLQVSGQWTNESLVFRSIDGEFRDFKLRTADLNINEPLIRLKGKGKWDSLSKELFVERATLASGALSMATEKFRWNTKSVGNLDGRIGFRSQLGRLQSWFPSARRTWPILEGSASGELAWRMKRGGTEFSGMSELAQLVVRSKKSHPANQNVLWQGRRARVQLKGEIASDGSRLLFNQLDVDADRLQVRASGSVERSPQQTKLSVRGRVAYDLDQWRDELARYLGPEIRLSGAQTRDFDFRGVIPSNPRQNESSHWQGQFSLGWDQAFVYGVDIKPNVLRARLASDRLQIEPMELSLSGGKLLLAGHLPLRQQPTVLRLRRGPLISKVDITEQMCSTWLKFVTPMVVNATRVSGSLSLDLENEPQIQLAKPGASHIEGALRIHQAKIGPAPMTNLLIWIAKQAKAVTTRQPLKLLPGNSAATWVTMPEQTTKFVCQKGRVTHNQLRFLVGDVEIYTQGSVGLDHSLKLIASIPIKDEWRQKSRTLKGYPGKTVDIPIKGSLRKPRSDIRVLLKLGTQLAPGAIENLIDKSLKRGLDKLFK